MKKGQVQLNVLAGIMGLVSSIGVPFLWVGNVKGDLESVNKVQDVRIQTIESANIETKSDIKEIRKGMNALLIKNGINPENIK